MFEINLWFITHDGLAMSRHICTCKASFLSVLVIKPEYFAKLLIVFRITETHHRVAVHEHTISLVRHYERNRYLRVVLEEFLVLSLVIEFVSLMLSEAIECLICRRIEYLTERISVSSLDLYRLE